jgi:hypothetical protein
VHEGERRSSQTATSRMTAELRAGIFWFESPLCSLFSSLTGIALVSSAF